MGSSLVWFGVQQGAQGFDGGDRERDRADAGGGLGVFEDPSLVFVLGQLTVDAEGLLAVRPVDLVLQIPRSSPMRRPVSRAMVTRFPMNAE